MIPKKEAGQATINAMRFHRVLPVVVGLLATPGVSARAASTSKAGLPPEIVSFSRNNSKSPREQKQMTTEADFAFRQAFALCPYSPEAIFRYVSLLVSADRIEDAIRVAGAARSLDLNNPQLENQVSELSRLKRARNR
jgi:hypothetical protein